MSLSNHLFKNTCILGISVSITACSLLSEQTSTIVYLNPDSNSNELIYEGYANEGQSETDLVDPLVEDVFYDQSVYGNNRMIDFSYAGYEGGGVAIPWVPVVKTLDPDPNGGDDHARIKEAINDMTSSGLVSKNSPGALLLKAGTYNVSETLQINQSGVVIRGEGQHAGGTVIRFAATIQDDLFEFNGSGGWSEDSSTVTGITDDVVPSGTNVFNVSNANNFNIGDRIIVSRTPNQDWLTLLGMDRLTDTDSGDSNWTTEGYISRMPRTITAISGNEITIDAPIVHAIETQYGGGTIQKYNFNSIQQVGIEQIRLESAYVSETDEDHGWQAVVFKRVENGWVRQVTAKYFGNSCTKIIDRCQYITIEDCAQLDPKSLIDGGRRYSFSLDDSSFVLFQRCYARDGRHDFVTSSRTVGPNVFVDCIAEGATSDIGPHERYAEGLLFDNIKGKAINVPNRLNSGSGHGWAGAQTVFWNCEADSFICDAPKAAMNFAIGNVGALVKGSATDEADGFVESQGTSVTPVSLYFTQLQDRLGETAYKNVTTPNQRQGRIWNDLTSWQQESAVLSTTVGTAIEITGVLEHQVPVAPGSSTTDSWSVLSGPGSATFGNANETTTMASFDQAGLYQLKYTSFQQENLDSGTYSKYATLTVIVSDSKNILDPSNFDPIGAVTNSTPTLTFDTDTLLVSGGELYGNGVANLNDDGSLVAVFAFDDIDLTTPPLIRGSLPIVIMSRGDLRVATEISVKGVDGSHKTHGTGAAGGGDGGDAALDSGIYPYDGQGPGGSFGSDGSQAETIASGGGGFVGQGGDSMQLGGTTYGDETLKSLIGGSGAGGTFRKGGGAGGGGIGLIAANDLEIVSGVTVDADGGVGAPSDSQWTSGGGSGGAILLKGDNITLDGILNANGGSGGAASGGQKNGGGGGGGRIAIYYRNAFVEGAGSDKTVSGGQPVGSDIPNQPGQAGEVGTIYINQFPVAVADSITTPKNSPAVISVLSNDSDPNGDTLSIVEITQPTNGTVTLIDSNTSVSYAPNQDFSGNDSFTYTVSDGTATDTATVTVVVTDANDTTPPSIPVNLIATAGDGSVVLNWTPNGESDLDSYTIYRSTTATAPRTYSILENGLNAAQYVDSSAANGTTYYYTVTAVDVNGNESDPSDEVSATPIEDTISPAAPTGLTAKASDGSVSLNWNSNNEPDLEGYIVYRSETAVGGYTAIATNISLNEYVDGSAANCTTYYYLITAVDAKGNESMKSAGVSAAPQIGATVFGLSNDGLDGFTKSTPSDQESWSVEAESVRYTNDGSAGGGTENSSLLKAVTLGRTVGKSYTIEGVIKLTSGYAEDNNRVGIYLFGDVNDLNVPDGLDMKKTEPCVYYTISSSAKSIYIRVLIKFNS